MDNISFVTNSLKACQEGSVPARYTVFVNPEAFLRNTQKETTEAVAQFFKNPKAVTQVQPTYEVLKRVYAGKDVASSDNKLLAMAIKEVQAQRPLFSVKSLIKGAGAALAVAAVVFSGSSKKEAAQPTCGLWQPTLPAPEPRLALAPQLAQQMCGLWQPTLPAPEPRLALAPLRRFCQPTLPAPEPRLALAPPPPRLNETLQADFPGWTRVYADDFFESEEPCMPKGEPTLEVSKDVPGITSSNVSPQSFANLNYPQLVEDARLKLRREKIFEAWKKELYPIIDTLKKTPKVAAIALRATHQVARTGSTIYNQAEVHLVAGINKTQIAFSALKEVLPSPSEIAQDYEVTKQEMGAMAETAIEVARPVVRFGLETAKADYARLSPIPATMVHRLIEDLCHMATALKVDVIDRILSVFQAAQDAFLYLPPAKSWEQKLKEDIDRIHSWNKRNLHS